jgi:hypothetical protein
MLARARPKGRASKTPTEVSASFSLLSVLGSVCILLAVAAPAKLNAFWGVNFWSLWPLPWRIAAAVLGLAALWFHDRLPVLPGVSNSRFGASLLPIAALSGFALLWIFLPARTLLFGDSMEVANRIGSQDWVTPRSPLYSLLVRGLGRIAGANHADLLAKAVQGISVVCGVITAALLFRLWKTRYRGMGLVLVATFLGGYIGLFQGYVEAYAVIVAAMCVYMTVLLAPRGRMQTIGLLLAQAFVIAAHIMGVLFLPVTLWMILDRFSRRTRTTLGLGSVILVALAVAVRSSELGRGSLAWIPPAHFFVRQVGYLVHPPSWSPGFFSVWHPIDIVNSYLLSVGAASVLGLVLASSSKGRAALGQALCSPVGTAALLFFIARCLVITPLGGPVLDWDLFAALGFPFAFLVLEAWKRRAFKSTHPGAGPSLLTVALVFVIPLVAMLASSTASTHRVLAYGSGSPNPSPVVQAQIAHHLGDQAARTGDENAPRLFSLAFHLDPNPVYARRAGEAWRLAGEGDKALQEFTHAIDRDSLDIVSLGQRGFLWLNQGDASRAERDFNAVLRIAPGNVRSMYGLGLVARLQNNPTLERTRMEAVVRRIEQELMQRPETSWLRSDLGNALYYLGRYDEAIVELQKALAIAPDRSGDWSTLGNCYRSLSQFEAAERAYQKASQLRARGGAGGGQGDLR